MKRVGVRRVTSNSQMPATARARLADVGGESPGRGTRARLLWDDAANTWGTTADGRWVSLAVGEPESSDVAIRDLLSGEQRRVTNKGGYAKTMGWVEETLISPDGSQIAFLWGQEETPNSNHERYTLRVVRADGTDERVLLEAKWSDIADWPYYSLYSWSPDGKWIALREFRGGRPWRIALVSADDGRVRTLFTLPDGQEPPDRIKFSPDGRWLAFDARAHSVEARRSVFTLPVAAAAPTPVEIAARAEVVGWTPDGNGILLTRLRDTTPELFLQPVSDGKASGEPRKVQAVSDFQGWPLAVTSSGSLLYSKENGTADSLVAELDLNSGTIGKTVISQPARDREGGGARFSPDGSRVLFILPGQRVLIRSFEDGSEHTMMLQMTSSYRVEWAADGRSLLVNGVGKDGKDGLYRVDVHSGAASLVAASQGGSSAFTVFAPSPDGRTVFLAYHGTSQGGLTQNGLSAIDLQTGNVRRPVWGKLAYGVRDLRFSHDGKRLALFGEGAVEIVDVGAGRIQRIISSGGYYHGGDWSPDDRFLFMTWGKGPTTLVKLPVEGGTPVKTALPADYRGLRLSPDGKRAAMTRWNEQHNQIWVLENFPPAAAPKK